MRDVIFSTCLDVSTADGKGDEDTSGGWFFPAEDGWDKQFSGDACLSGKASEEV